MTERIFFLNHIKLHYTKGQLIKAEFSIYAERNLTFRYVCDKCTRKYKDSYSLHIVLYET